MRSKVFVSALLAAFAPGVVLADLNYSGVEFSFVDVELGDSLVDVDGDGHAIGGSFEMGDRYFMFGEYGDQGLDFGIDYKSFEVGAGFHHEIDNNFDFVGTVSFVDAEVEFGGFSVDDDGFGIGAGLRSRIGRSFEIEGGLKYVDLDESGSDTGFNLGGRYYFNDTWALSGGLDDADNAETFHIGVRAEF